MKLNKKSVIRILGSIILLMFVMRAVIIEEILFTLSKLNLWIYFASFAVYLGNKLISSYRWQLLLQVQNINLGLLELYKINLLGLVFNSVLPSTVGGESVRIYWLVNKYPEEKTPSVIATLADKILGLIALVFLVFVVLPFNTLIDDQIRNIGIVLLGSILLIILSAVLAPNSGIAKMVRRLMFSNWLKIMYDKTIVSLNKYRNEKRIVAKSFLLAVVFQTIAVVNQYLRFKSLDIDVSLLYLFLAIPVTTLIVTIPISIGGLGLREISLIGLLAVTGIENHEVFSYTIVGYSALLLMSILLAIYNAVFGFTDFEAQNMQTE